MHTFLQKRAIIEQFSAKVGWDKSQPSLYVPPGLCVMAWENEESASKVIKSLFGICILSRFASRLAAAATKVKPFLVVTL